MKNDRSKNLASYSIMGGWKTLQLSSSSRTMLGKSFKVFLSENVKIRNVKVDGGGVNNVLTHRLNIYLNCPTHDIYFPFCFSVWTILMASLLMEY